MANNQNDNRNQQSDSKSNQPAVKDGNKKETDPNNPSASQIKSPENKQHGETVAPTRKTNTSKDQPSENEREEDGTHGASKVGDPDAEPIETIKGGL